MNFISHLRNNHSQEYAIMNEQSSEGFKELLSKPSNLSQRQLKDS